MEILLPPKAGAAGNATVNILSSLVVIGANGSGKTRFGAKIEELRMANTHRISAQKSLAMPVFAPTSTLSEATDVFLYGGKNTGQDAEWLVQSGKKAWRWGNNLAISPLNDFDKLMTLLLTQEFEELSEAKRANRAPNETNLDRIKRIWELVLPQRILTFRSGSVLTAPVNDQAAKYSGSEMSDGERVVFYLVGEVVCAPADALIIIDEPEMHLHRSIISHLFDLMESVRPDCKFIYLTHDIEFASTRTEAIKIWLKSFGGADEWDYDLLPDESPIPEDVYLATLGSRKPVLFVEGTDGSRDRVLYERIFRDRTVKPVGSCEKVITTTRAFNDNQAFHHLVAQGLVDRDRRNPAEIQHLRGDGFLIPETAELENIFLLEEVVRSVAQRMGQVADDVFQGVKTNVINAFTNDKERQATQHSIFWIKTAYRRDLNPQVSTKTALAQAVANFNEALDPEKIHDGITAKFQSYIDTDDYLAILRVFNHKGLISQSQVCGLCALANSKETYMDYVLALLKNDGPDATVIRNAIRGAIN